MLIVAYTAKHYKGLGPFFSQPRAPHVKITHEPNVADDWEIILTPAVKPCLKILFSVL